jgi:hypothetical protein
MFSDPIDFLVNNTFAPLSGKPIKLWAQKAMIDQIFIVQSQK